MQNQILGFFIITSVALGVLCAVQWKHVQEQRMAEGIQKQEISDMSIKLDGQANTIESLKRDRGRLDKEISQLSSVVNRLQESTNAYSRQLTRLAEAFHARQEAQLANSWFLALLEDPAIKAWFDSEQASFLDHFYGKLFEDLALDDEEKTQLSALLMAQQWRVMDANLAVLEGEGDAAALAKATEENQAQIRSLLGDERFEYFQQFLKKRGQNDPPAEPPTEPEPTEAPGQPGPPDPCG